MLQQLSALSNDSYRKETLYQDFQTIASSIVVLAPPPSVTSPPPPLKVPQATIQFLLRPFYSVLLVPDDIETPIHTLHLSFSEFLLSDQVRNEHFEVDGPATHRMLLLQCLKILSGPDGLRENVYDLRYPGQPRRELDSSRIKKCVPSALQYACRYWVYHIQYRLDQIRDDNEVHKFLKQHFLHWLEALSLLGIIAEAVRYVDVLKSLFSVSDHAS